MISSQETYLLRLISCVEHVVASQFAQEIRKDPKMKKKKKKLSVTVTYLLNAKT